MEYLEGQSIKLMSHSAHSPDLSLCDFCLFPKNKELFRGKNFQDMNELDAVAQVQIADLRKEDFYQCFEH